MGQPVANATIKANGCRVKTGSDGNYTLTVELGTCILTVSKKGFRTETKSVDVLEKKPILSICPLPEFQLSK